MKQLHGILWFIPAAIILSLLIGYLGRPRLERSLQVAVDMAPAADTIVRWRDRPASSRPYPGRTDYQRSERRELPAPFAFDANTLDAAGFEQLGFSPRQAEVILRYRASLGGFRDVSQFAECYVVSGEMFARLEPHITLSPPPEIVVERISDRSFERQTIIELNSADSAQLVAVSGIGALTASRIIAFRTALGGFARVEQLAEVRGMTRENYERILTQISLDPAGIQKIDINFASPQTLAEHPYFTPEVLRKVVKNRQLKGGWSSAEQLVLDKTLTSQQAERLAPYLTF